MIPHRLAIALQDDGWYVRSDIIWHKSNPMPESVTDRPTKAHEYIFLLAKSEKYFYDAEAIAEPCEMRRLSSWSERKTDEPLRRGDPSISCHVTRTATLASKEGRNKRSVWTLPTQAYPEAHFATFPEDLITPCIKAGCPHGGTVLDPFGGSGTTGLVARRMGCRAVLIELSADYAKLAAKRLSQGVLELQAL
jgi:DNA modification methylase